MPYQYFVSFGINTSIKLKDIQLEIKLEKNKDKTMPLLVELHILVNNPSNSFYK